MPTAPDEQRAIIRRWFGDDIDSHGPEQFLRSHGYVLRRDWTWELPTPAHTPSCYEMECMLFLYFEWDYGMVVGVDQYTARCVCGKHDREAAIGGD